MFGATFNLRVRTNVIFGTLTDGSLEINSLALNNCFSYCPETYSKMAPTLCQKWF